METIERLLHEGLAHQQNKRLSQAERAYRAALELDPKQPDGLHLLGLTLAGLGDTQSGIASIRKAIEATPNNPVFWGNLGVLLRQSNQIELAIEAYLESIRLAPQVADTHFHLGKAFKAKGDFEQARLSYEKSIELNRRNPSPWLGLISLEAEKMRFDRAIDYGGQALSLFPSHVDLLMSVGAVYRRHHQPEKALELYRAALSYQPNHIDALCRVGSTLLSLLRIAEAKPYIDKAATLAPEDVHVLNAYGLLYNTLGDSHAAVQYYRRSLSRYPDHANTYCNLSNALRKIGQLTEALEAIRKGIELGSDSADSHVIEAGVLMSLGQVDEAADRLRHSIERKNGYRDAHDTLLMCMHYQHSTSLKGLYEEHCCWDQRYAVHLRQGTASKPPRIPREKIRIGFTSGDLGAHPVGYFTVRLFESLNRDRFETFIYSDRLSRDWLTQRIQNCATGWHETSGVSDAALENKILAENLDILFDLTGHTAQNRLLVFARRVAPVQISWAGYVGTTGLSEMDYLLADPFHVPPEMEPFITEKVLRMPNGYVTYCPPEKTPAVAKLPALKNGFLTFAAMCNPAKVNPVVLKNWAEILCRVPGSRLLLAYSGWTDASNRKRVEGELETLGLSDRIRFDYRSGADLLMELYNEVDLALDTFPYSGGLTTCEALWMGVPTVTFPGKWFAGRHSTSHMMNVGLPQFVAKDVAEYVEKAVYFATHPEELADIRGGLRDQMIRSPLCDGPLFAKNFEALMEELVRKDAGPFT